MMNRKASAPKPEPYLDPKEPTLLGFLIVISLCKSLKGLGSLGF